MRIFSFFLILILSSCSDSIVNPNFSDETLNYNEGEGKLVTLEYKVVDIEIVGSGEITIERIYDRYNETITIDSSMILEYTGRSSGNGEMSGFIINCRKLVSVITGDTTLVTRELLECGYTDTLRVYNHVECLSIISF